jgi:hypothetical protein
VISPDIFELFKRAHWDRFLHSWTSFHSLLVPLVAWLAKVWQQAVSRRKARLAENWPVADGRVQSTNVTTLAAFFGVRKQYNASFKYSYSVREGSETNYFTGDFARPFPDKESAWEWLESLKGKQIRVHIQPGHAETSVVLAADLDAHFALPLRAPAGISLPSSSLLRD